MIMLRLYLLTCALLVTVATTNKTVCIAGATSLGAEQLSSECLSCHEDIDGQNGSSHSGSHAIGITYADHAARNEKLRPVLDLPSALILFEGVVTCATCHGSDPHDGQALVISNSESVYVTHATLCNVPIVPQQIADTAEAYDVHDRLSLVGGDGHGLILIDQELGRDADSHD